MFPRILFLSACSSSLLHALPEGYEIHEFAAPPHIEYPTAITVAPNGDVYVSSDKNGSLGKEKDMGRIIRCRDTDGDGKADQFIDFVPSVSSPRGGHIVGDTLYLIHPPFLSSYRDADGDGVAEESKVLVTGFGGGIEHPRGADHTTNGVRMGIDGWLYVSVGDFGMAEAKGADGTTYTLHGGGVVRVRPDGSEMEPYALMVRNICDTAISPTLDLFSRDNTNDGKGWNTRFHHYTALGDHGYPRLYQNFADEAIVPLADYGGGSGTGALWVSEPGFSGGFGEMLYSCDWTTGNILYHPAKRVGASYEVEQKVFHPVGRAIDIDVDGFSRLYIADWRGGAYKYAGPNKPVGMIQQVTCGAADGKARYQDVTKADEATLVSLLASASGVQRFAAQQQLLRKPRTAKTANAILQLAKDPSQSEAVRVAAIFTCKQLMGVAANAALDPVANDPGVREYVLRALADRKGEMDGVDAGIYQKYLTDGNPRVVLQAVIGLERLGAKDAAPSILAASRNWKEEGVSPRLRHTAVAALTSLGNVAALVDAVNDDALRPIALGALQKIHRKDAVDGLARVVQSTDKADVRFDCLSALARLHFTEKAWDLISWWGTRPDDRGPFFEPVEWEESARIRGVLESAFSTLDAVQKRRFLGVLSLNRLPVSQLKLEGLDPVMAALGNPAPSAEEISILTDAALDVKRGFPERLACYRALAKVQKAKDGLKNKLSVLAAWSEEKGLPADASQQIDDFVNDPQRAGESGPLRQLAAKEGDAISRIAWRALLATMQSPITKPKVKDQVKNMVAENPREIGFFQALVDLQMTGFDPQIEAALKSDNAKLIAAAKQARQMTGSAGGSGKKVAELPMAEVFQAAMNGHGDVATGKRLYTAQGCIACHAVDLKAEQKGPYLGAAGAKFTRDYLIESVLDPNKVVAQGFRTTMVKMKNGASHIGFVTGEEDGVVQLRNIAGQVTLLKRAEVSEESHLPQSMMPPGLAAGLSVEDFVSLIEYLASLKAQGG